MNSNLPYKVNWVNLSCLGVPDPLNSVAIGSLPGCRHRFISRDLNNDLDVLLNKGIRNIFILIDDLELQRFGVRNLPILMHEKGINARFFACELGSVPRIEIIMQIIREIYECIGSGQKSIIISRDGYGRSCVVAGCLLLHSNDAILHDEVYDSLKRLVGPRAVQTVKQYNFLVDFRQLRDQLEESRESENIRCISR